jgi:glycosyltransferase involved in cell wall biosynthesis
MSARVLIVTQDVLLPRMAGPAMRAWHIAEHLARDHDVKLLTTSPRCQVASDRFHVSAAGRSAITEAEAWCDVMILQGYVTTQHPVLEQTSKIVVFDVYDPLHLETLAFTNGVSSEVRLENVQLSVANLNYQLARADFLICASERQRDFYLGQLAALGRLNTTTYDNDPTLRRLIDVVPFGLPNDDPEHSRRVLKGIVPGIDVGDELVLWGGGIYDWLDPLTLIRAIDRLSQRHPNVRLYFLGGVQHPNPAVPRMVAAGAAKRIAAEMSLLNKHVFFNDRWVDYSDRQNYLLEADIGTVCHFANAESRFAFRTRALDYLWARLPMVSTEGDSFSDLINKEGLGLTVPAEDSAALASAIAELLENPSLAQTCRERAHIVRDQYRWANVLQPLLAFCKDPQHAQDLNRSTTINPVVPTPKMSFNKAVRLSRHYYHSGGIREVLKRATDKVIRTSHEKS